MIIRTLLLGILYINFQCLIEFIARTILKLTKENLGWDINSEFHVPDEVINHFDIIKQNGANVELAWNEQLNQFIKSYPKIYEGWSKLFSSQESHDWMDITPSYEIDEMIATRSASGDFLNYISDFLNKTRVLVPVPMSFMKPMINIAEKTPISPLTSEQLLLFEKDNLVINVDKSFQNLDINPQDTLQILKNIVVN